MGDEIIAVPASTLRRWLRFVMLETDALTYHGRSNENTACEQALARLRKISRQRSGRGASPQEER